MLFGSLVFGFTTGLSLIVAIGSQNAFVLRQGIRKEHVLITALVCSLSDAILITAGASGMSALVERAPLLLVFARVGGFIFLLSYAIFAFRRAVKPEALKVSSIQARTAKISVIETAFALTWPNLKASIATVSAA